MLSGPVGFSIFQKGTDGIAQGLPPRGTDVIAGVACLGELGTGDQLGVWTVLIHEFDRLGRYRFAEDTHGLPPVSDGWEVARTWWHFNPAAEI
ncbi:hypothetical protein GLI01_33250 [Gluconacetobacter liquefaciens]|uniref:Uncharacterized protein n=1 Tax=Gluconacetobacter liquefaciens TaxID=89584 RepID=A0A7W4PED3_GLULI|nr:hypothetical protein [Gluconacetobacter liquefaciens]MBB2187741.1 hypothetical protein [Gluconacetobacter liquefaciens]GEB39290.1 hypothetical protein GLI01_33250 [Gluconacetobacter liquefaciens]